MRVVWEDEEAGTNALGDGVETVPFEAPVAELAGIPTVAMVVGAVGAAAGAVVAPAGADAGVPTTNAAEELVLPATVVKTT